MTHPTWLDQALDLILKEEGGYDEREFEGGGAVNMGITLNTYRDWRKANGLPAPTKEDLKAMSEDEAKQIYFVKYALPMHFDAMQPGVGYILLDSATNNGVTGCQRFVEQATGHTTDGKFDPFVFWAVRHRDPAQFINAFCDARKAAIPHFKNANVQLDPAKPRTWGDVLLARNERVRQRALEMAARQ